MIQKKLYTYSKPFYPSTLFTTHFPRCPATTMKQNNLNHVSAEVTCSSSFITVADPTQDHMLPIGHAKEQATSPPIVPMVVQCFPMVSYVMW